MLMRWGMTKTGAGVGRMMWGNADDCLGWGGRCGGIGKVGLMGHGCRGIRDPGEGNGGPGKRNHNPFSCKHQILVCDPGFAYDSFIASSWDNL